MKNAKRANIFHFSSDFNADMYQMARSSGVSKRDIELKAKSLVESSPQEAVLLYQKLWSEFNNEFNNWDAFFNDTIIIAKPDSHMKLEVQYE